MVKPMQSLVTFDGYGKVELALAPRLERQEEFSRSAPPKAVRARNRRKKGSQGGIHQRRNKRWSW